MIAAASMDSADEPATHKDAKHTIEACTTRKIKPGPPPPEPEQALFEIAKLWAVHSNKGHCLGSLRVTNKRISFLPRSQRMKRYAFHLMMRDVVSVTKNWGRGRSSAFVWGMLILAASFLLLFPGYADGIALMVACGWVYAGISCLLFWLASIQVQLTLTTADRGIYLLRLTGRSKKNHKHLLHLIDVHKGKP